MAGPSGEGCPSCGASLSPLESTCEACGYSLLSESGGAAATETGPCERCGGELSVEATYCHHCGHTVRRWRLVPALLMIVGFCLTASIVGAVVGVPMQLLALRMVREAREGTVVAT